MNCPDELGAIHEVYYRVKEEAEKEGKSSYPLSCHRYTNNKMAQQSNL